VQRDLDLLSDAELAAVVRRLERRLARRRKAGERLRRRLDLLEAREHAEGVLAVKAERVEWRRTWASNVDARIDAWIAVGVTHGMPCNVESGRPMRREGRTRSRRSLRGSCRRSSARSGDGPGSPGDDHDGEPARIRRATRYGRRCSSLTHGIARSAAQSLSGRRSPSEEVGMPGSEHHADGLREARERAGLSRVELARRAGCSLASLANYEQGIIPIKGSEVLRRAWAALREVERTVEAA
jgi:DNA-binding XRE family transcriptional regulator